MIINIAIGTLLESGKVDLNWNLSSSKVCMLATGHYVCYPEELIKKTQINHLYKSLRLSIDQSVKAQKYEYDEVNYPVTS